MDNHHETSQLGQELSEMKGRLQRLQISRRVLMNLLEKYESEKAITLERLIRENEELRRANRLLLARLSASRERVFQWRMALRKNGLNDLIDDVEKGVIHSFIPTDPDFVGNKKILPIAP